MPTNRLPGLAATTYLFLASCVLAACGTGARAPLPPQPNEPAPVLLVSIDGFRADYLDLGITPNLSRIARDGVRAQWMISSYPTLTFPNHYTLVTGLRPDRHGIVHNTMNDPALGKFSLARRDAVGDGRWWGGEPLWVSVQKAGLPAATMFWPGSEAAIQGVRPTRWMPYEGAMSMERRVDTVLKWLREPVSARPRFVTLYFDALDHAGHDYGADAPQTRATLREVDAAIGRLARGLSSAPLRGHVNLVIVSDHGMANMPPQQVIAIEDVVPPSDAKAVTTGQVLGFAPLPGRERAAQARLLGRHSHYQCWRKNEMPAHWHYGTHPRIPPIVCQMDVGWEAIPRKRAAERAKRGTRGAHGFAPEAPEMRALFVAKGPAFRSGATVAPFENVDVYPLLAKLTGVAPAPNDGNPATLLPILRETPSH